MTQRRPSPSGDNFHVRLPNGRPLAICEWMTQPESATYAVCDRPRLTREAYSDLRMIVDTVLCFLAQDGGNDDAPHADYDRDSCSTRMDPTTFWRETARPNCWLSWLN